jgi:hypothetical protein
MKKSNFQKPLFGVSDKKDTKAIEQPKRRGRPPKQKQDKTLKQNTPKKDSPKIVSKIGEKKKLGEKIVEKSTPQKSNVKANKGWKDYNTSKPELMHPCEFYTQDDKGKQYMFYGYLESDGWAVTDDPYKLVVLRKKFGNMFYRELPCKDLSNCKDNFPHCKTCKLNKEK